MAKYPLLSQLNSPADIHNLDIEQKKNLADEIRAYIIEVTSQNGGHLASSLGTVELTIALLSMIDIVDGNDRVVWDVGHQAYPWKLLTGRYKEFTSLRMHGGISGFLRMEESPYDYFGAGHASTSIAATIGMALAHKYQNIQSHNFAIIGDGALTGGLAFEALNNIGCVNAKIIIILNDNKFSISDNVGSLSRFISRSLVKGTMRHLKKGLKSIAGEGKFVEYLRKGERSFKSFVTPGMLFEALSLTYLGPVQGHDIASLEQHIGIAMQQERSVVLHIYTEKGKGFLPAERDPIKFHGVGKFTVQDNQVSFPPAPQHTTYTAVVTQTLSKLALAYENIIAITAAMPEGTGIGNFAKSFPHRALDVGICEGYAVTMSGGLAREGMIPIVAIYSTFLQRAYDNIIHDICIQNLHVVFCIDRAGLVGEDGATHHGVFDIAYLRILPNMVSLAPSDENELQNALYTAIQYNGPIAIRYPKEYTTGALLNEEYSLLPLRKGRYINYGQDIAIISLGTLLSSVQEAVSSIEETYHITCTIYDARWIKPLAEEDLCHIAKEHRVVLIFEEGCKAGGFGSSVLELYAEKSCLPLYCQHYGIQDTFIEHGKRTELLSSEKLDTKGIYSIIESYIGK